MRGAAATLSTHHLAWLHFRLLQGILWLRWLRCGYAPPSRPLILLRLALAALFGLERSLACLVEGVVAKGRTAVVRNFRAIQRALLPYVVVVFERVVEVFVLLHILARTLLILAANPLIVLFSEKFLFEPMITDILTVGHTVNGPITIILLLVVSGDLLRPGSQAYIFALALFIVVSVFFL